MDVPDNVCIEQTLTKEDSEKSPSISPKIVKQKPLEEKSNDGSTSPERCGINLFHSSIYFSIDCILHIYCLSGIVF